MAWTFKSRLSSKSDFESGNVAFDGSQALDYMSQVGARTAATLATSRYATDLFTASDASQPGPSSPALSSSLSNADVPAIGGYLTSALSDTLNQNNNGTGGISQKWQGAFTDLNADSAQTGGISSTWLGQPSDNTSSTAHTGGFFPIAPDTKLPEGTGGFLSPNTNDSGTSTGHDTSGDGFWPSNVGLLTGSHEDYGSFSRDFAALDILWNSNCSHSGTADFNRSDSSSSTQNTLAVSSSVLQTG